MKKKKVRIKGKIEKRAAKGRYNNVSCKLAPAVLKDSGYRRIAGFEKLWVWQKAYKPMITIHTFCQTLPGDERYKLRDQIERSTSSVWDNIAEGHSAYYYLEKIKGFNVARKEAGEAQNQIRKLHGKGYLDLERAQAWVESYEEVIRGINGFVRFVRK